MTLQQLNDVIAIAETGSFNRAAERLYIAQPSLTSAIKELEKELGVILFNRSGKGATLTGEGVNFLPYARSVIMQYQNLLDAYGKSGPRRERFAVSTQHYSFAVEAFVELLKEYGGDKYEFHMRETQTYDIIDDVAHLRSEIGILYLNKFNETVIRKTLRDNGLTFHSLFKAKPHVFIGKDSPLAKKKSLTLDDLKKYPRLSYEQGSHNSFYFSEEILSTVDSDKEIIVRDRATLFNMLIGLDGYTICSGVISEELNGPSIIAKPLKVDDYMEIGYILPSGITYSKMTGSYIEMLKASCKFDKLEESKYYIATE